MKTDLIEIFIEEKYSSPPKKNYETKKILYNQIDAIWSIDLADFSEYKTSNNKGFPYIFVLFDNFSEHLLCVPLKNKNSQTITQEFSNILTTSKRSPVKIESDRGAEFPNCIFQNFLKVQNIHHYSRFTDKGPSIAERIIRTIRNLLKKPGFDKGNANWISALPSVNKTYNNTVHNSTKKTAIQGNKKVNEKIVYSNLQDRRVRQQPKFKPGQLVRTADNKTVTSKGDSTNYSYKIYTITVVIHDTIPSYRIKYFPERFNQNLLLPTNLSLEQNNQVMKKLNLIQ